jgi:uncharacterized membrane protein YdjX (TVP38/TMEM64 family)
MTWAFFKQRLILKLESLTAIVIGSLLIVGIFSALIYLAKFILPDSYSQFMALLDIEDFEQSKNTVKNFFDSFGDWEQAFFIFVQILQVFFAPIPGQLTGFLGGFLFGFWHGLFLTMLGLTIGSFLAIGLSRLLRDYLVQKFVPENILKQFDYLIEKGGLMTFFMIFLLPAFPDDAVCFIAGLTRLSLSKLVIVCVLGRLPGMAVLTFAGTAIDTDLQIAQIILGVAMVISIVIWFFEEEITNYVKKFENNAS